MRQQHSAYLRWLIFIFSGIAIIIILLLYIPWIPLFEIEKPTQFVNVTPDLANTDSQLVSQLRSERQFWQNRLQLAESNTINLLLNLDKNEVILELRGVTLFTCKIQNTIINQSLTEIIDGSNNVPWLSNPLVLRNEWATLAKEPIQVREIRPRSELENVLTHLRDPEDEIEAHVFLQFSDSLLLSLKQVEPGFVKSPDKFSGFGEFEPHHIELYLARTEVVALYRAVNIGETKLAIRF